LYLLNVYKCQSKSHSETKEAKRAEEQEMVEKMAGWAEWVETVEWADMGGMAATMEVGVMGEGVTEGMQAVETEEARAEEKTEIEECPKERSWCCRMLYLEAEDKFPISKSSNKAHSLVPVK
jgi:hypothetical protein